jgi:hypothetical protein
MMFIDEIRKYGFKQYAKYIFLIGVYIGVLAEKYTDAY